MVTPSKTPRWVPLTAVASSPVRTRLNRDRYQRVQPRSGIPHRHRPRDRGNSPCPAPAPVRADARSSRRRRDAAAHRQHAPAQLVRRVLGARTGRWRPRPARLRRREGSAVTPPAVAEQHDSLAAMIGTVAEGNPATDLGRALLRLDLVRAAQDKGLSWAAIGTALGYPSGRQAKKAIHDLKRSEEHTSELQ